MDTRAIGRDWPERIMDRFSSGRPLMEILRPYDAMVRNEASANDDGPNWAAIRDHSPGDLANWLDGVACAMLKTGATFNPNLTAKTA